MEWQPIETAPKDGTYFLAAKESIVGKWIITVCQDYGDNRGVIVSWDHHEALKPHYWMPLPPPPTKGTE